MPAALGVDFPVATPAAALILIDDAVHSMTPVALKPVQVEMRFQPVFSRPALRLGS